jgi:hypothetical protein
VVVVGGAPDAPWLRPIELALQRLHVPLSSSELWPFDALRTATLARRLRPRAVIGPDQALSAALAGDDGYVAALRDVPAVFTRLGGAEPLRAVGLAPRTIAFLGPAIGLEWPDGRLLVDGTEWSLRSADGQLLLSTRGERAEPVEDLPLGIAGAVTATDGTDLQVTLH